MSNPQKSKGRSLKQMLHSVADRLSPASRTPSPVPLRGSNVHDIGSDGTQGLDASASHATAFTDLSHAVEFGNSASGQPPVIASPTMGHGEHIKTSQPQVLIKVLTLHTSDAQVGVRDHAEAGSRAIRVDVSQINLTRTDNRQSHLAKSAWHGMQILLKMVEKLLEGTPVNTPIAAVNVLIDLGSVCPHHLLSLLPET
ncbi:hypothetical protein C0989_009146 [Termitomyces sp. Mn162]|nr:hypothetical protein C0989_009146 [Termitomyces sp. Mn162]